MGGFRVFFVLLGITGCSDFPGDPQSARKPLRIWEDPDLHRPIEADIVEMPSTEGWTTAEIEAFCEQCALSMAGLADRAEQVRLLVSPAQINPGLKLTFTNKSPILVESNRAGRIAAVAIDGLDLWLPNGIGPEMTFDELRAALGGECEVICLPGYRCDVALGGGWFAQFPFRGPVELLEGARRPANDVRCWGFRYACQNR